MKLQDLSTVVMPVALRPEFAALALERLAMAQFCPDVMVFVDDVDFKLKEEFAYVQRQFTNLITTWKYRLPHVPAPSGCWNILNSIQDGYRSGAQLIFLVEEDVMVKPDFFLRHWSIMQTGQYVASCGRKDVRFNAKHPNTYTNPGSCLSRGLVYKLIPHINNDYFTRLRGYMDEFLPPKWDEISDLDDGLIRRVIRQSGGKCFVPETPLCAHQGLMAYEERMDFMKVGIGPIEERIAYLRELLPTLDPAGRYTRDFEPL